MWRALWYLTVIVVVAIVAVWLADHPGRVRIDWLGYRAEPPIGVLFLLLAVIAGFVAFLYRLWLGVRRSGAQIGLWRAQRRRKRGYEALTRGMVAVAAGEKSEASTLARRAETLLDEPPLTLLLSAQAAQLNGDERAAERFFRAMTEDRQTEFLGLRGLVTQAVKRGEQAEALALAERAFRLKPDTDWVAETLFDLQVGQGQWEKAAATLKDSRRHRLTNDAQAGRRQVVLTHQLGCARRAEGRLPEAARLMRKALKVDPDFLPAILDLAAILLETNKAAKARDLIKNAWKRRPHPGMVAPFVAATEPTDALHKVKLLDVLYKGNPDHMESSLVVAAACLEAQLWGEARRYLAPWLSGDPSARVCRLMAEIEESENGDSAGARDWLARAAVAAPDHAWVCRTCGQVHGQWSALCDKCGAFDSLSWGQPPRAAPLSSDATATSTLTGPSSEEDAPLPLSLAEEGA